MSTQVETVMIRPIGHDDVKGFHALRCMAEVRDRSFKFITDDFSETESYIKGLGEQDHMMVAMSEGEIVGAISLHIKGQRRARHCASVVVIVHPRFRETRVGCNLMTPLIDLADNWLMLVRLESDVLASDQNTADLLMSKGFVVEGTKRGAVSWGDGTYRDLVTLARYNERLIPSLGTDEIVT